LITIKTLTGELEEKFPFFKFTDYSVMDDGSIIVQNEGGKIGIRNNGGKWELIPNHARYLSDEFNDLIERAKVFYGR